MGMSERGKRSPRAGARRRTLERLDGLKRNVEKLRGWWSIPTTIYRSAEESGTGRGEWVPRPAGEYPEAQRHYWAATVNEIDAMVADLYTLRAHCLEEYRKTPEKE